MAQNRKKPKVGKIKAEDVLTSRLMCALLYFFFYAFVILIVANSVASGFAAIAWWFVLGAALVLVLPALFYYIRKRRANIHEHLRVHSSGFLLSLAVVLLLSIAPVAVFGSSGYWYSVIFAALCCFFYFLTVVYRRWVVMLGLDCLVLFGLTFLTEIQYFNLYWLTRAIFSLVLALVAFAVAAILCKLRERDGVIVRKNEKRTTLVITGEGARYWTYVAAAAAFTVGLILRVIFPEQTLFCALAAPAFFLIFLIAFSVWGKDKR